MNRRDFIKLLAAASGTAAGGYLLATYAPWLDYDEAALEARSVFEESSMDEPMRELIRYATMAANGHNAQAWKFAVAENEITLLPDQSRRQAVVDPEDRELWISLGCALENLLIAACAAGFDAEVDYPDEQESVRVKLEPGSPLQGPLFEAIPLRQNTRSKYDGRPVAGEDFAKIEGLPLDPGVSLSFASTRERLTVAADAVYSSTLQQYADREFLDELIAWLRFTRKEAMATADGLFSRCSGNPEVPRWLGKRVVAGMKPQQQAQADADKMRSLAGAVVIASQEDEPAAWVRTGQVYERLALTLTSLGIQSAFLNQPIEVAGLRGEFQSAMGLGDALPQLLVRYGYGPALPRSLRRPVEQVLA
ncbi:MAG: twin-arginine translocation signal domain-containing protein [Anaerolineaceae bacterium]|nr:twin-arginine translocation signal domain-containing protein [Anaerolineaceae bacterium]